MQLILIIFGAFFGLWFLANNLLQTVRKRERLGRIGTVLAFLTVGTLLAALILGQLAENPRSFLTRGVWAASAVILIVSLLTLIAELRRKPRNLIQSRGILGTGVAILIAVSTFTIPFTAAYFDVLPSPASSAAVPAGSAAAVTGTPGADPAMQEQFTRFFRNIFQIVGETTGLDNQTLVDQLQKPGMTVAQLIEDNDGSLDAVVAEVVSLTRAEIQGLIADGRIPRLQGALIVGNLEFFIRTAMNTEIEPDRLDDLTALLLATEAPTEAVEASATATPFVPTATATPTATLTRTPRPSPTATATRQRFATRTPTLTPTLPNPCLALVDYNLNLRAAPTSDAEVLVVIPFNTTITLFARSEDSAWWLASYDGQAGWVRGEYMRLSDSCAELPVQ